MPQDLLRTTQELAAVRRLAGEPVAEVIKQKGHPKIFMNVDLTIGGYRIRLEEPKNRHISYWPHSSFEPFSHCNESPELHFEINVCNELPSFSHQGLLFDSNHGLWKLYGSEKGYYLETFNPLSKKPYTRSLISLDYSRVQVFVREMRETKTGQVGWRPLEIINPTVELCLLTRLARDGGLQLHAAGMKIDLEGFIFTGPSGAGKSTISGFFISKGAFGLSDETLLLRKIENEFVIFGTPWPGEGHVTGDGNATLRAVYFIRHGSGSHQLKRLSALETHLLLWKQLFLPLWDAEALEKTAQICGDLSQEVDCFDLAFLKNADVVEFIQGRRNFATVKF